jgi:hypothetical protein
MPEIKLTNDEQNDIAEQQRIINAVNAQIQQLARQRDQAIKAGEYIWTSATYRSKLDESLDVDCDVPDLIDKQTLNSPIKIKDGIASWENTTEEGLNGTDN